LSRTRNLRLLDAAAVQAMLPVLKPEVAQSALFEPGAADMLGLDANQTRVQTQMRSMATLCAEVAI
jgi:hypothetical protein